MTDYRKPTLKEVIRAQVAYLFSRWRPVGGLSEEEQKAVAAERVEFTERVFGYVRVIQAPESEIIVQIRESARALQADQRLDRLPSPEQVAARVKAHFAAKATRAPCEGCATMGGSYAYTGDDAPLQRKEDGLFPWPEGLFLCHAHHMAANYYSWREHFRREGGHSTKPGHLHPPAELLPRGYYASPERPDVTPWTDGEKMGPMAKWARPFVERVYGVMIPAAEATWPTPAPQEFPEV